MFTRPGKMPADNDCEISTLAVFSLLLLSAGPWTIERRAGCHPVKGSKVGPFRARTTHTTGHGRVNTARVYTARVYTDRVYTAYTARG